MSENLPIRVLIVDDHVMIRRGLRSYLLGRSDMAVVGEAGDGEAAVQAVASLRPEVVLLDINMPKLDGIAAAGIIHRQHPSVKILMLTSFQESDLMRAALAAGAAGYLLKDAPEEDLIAAIRLAHRGHRIVPPGLDELGIAPQAIEPPAAPVPPPPPPKAAPELTEREREILALMIAGMTNKAIAHRSSLSLSTVKFHVSNVIAKLGVSSRTEAVSVALKLRLFP